MVRVVNHSANGLGLGRLHSKRLNPGVNEVDPEVWATVQRAPVVVALLKLGENGGLTVSEGSGPSNPPAAPDLQHNLDDPPLEVDETAVVPALGEMTAADAKEVVAACDDSDALAQWLRTENRKTVVAAIDKRLAALQNAGN